MITSLQDYNHVVIFYEALKLRSDSFNFIKKTLLQQLELNPNFTIEQKVAIRLASKELVYMGSTIDNADSVLIQILSTKWQDIGLNPDDITALSTEAYELIIEGLMTICRNMLEQESVRLQSVSQLTTTLPEGWDLVTPEEPEEEGPTEPENPEEPPLP